MKFMVKILAVVVGLGGLFALSFAIWGERLEGLFSPSACVRWFAASRDWAWAVAIALLISDLLLPIPATGVMAALGIVYGPVLGGAIGACGSVASALAGYGLARLAGPRIARLIADERERERFQGFFDRWGGVAVIVSRPLPILPEVTSILAGLASMNFGRFLVALLLGTVPSAFLFASLGAVSAEAPLEGIVIATILPLLIWILIASWIGSRRSPPRPPVSA
ncbi:MAG: hypothetical protein A2Z34_08595 [Planctomycetes bacterium RBG_16_59_8]|nr:MAG: hypothetical protein A2Z34_08595 [Planctomycetes bacterium RBG_16_59_8]